MTTSSASTVESTAEPPAGQVNVAARLSETARNMPDAVAVAFPRGRDERGRRRYETITFRELDEDTDRLAAGLAKLGVTPGTRLALMVPPGIEFISLVFALFKSGAVSILIDPGMGRRNLLRCLADAEPDGFVAVALVHAVRTLVRRRFPRARLLVTVGRRWFWGGVTIGQLRLLGDQQHTVAPTRADDPAAIIFTTGSTGPPKGVLYRHGNFNAQVDQLREFYDVRPGEIDLPGFPLFALLGAAMGVTTVIPDMDPRRPAHVDPRRIVEAIHDWNVTGAFGSPALWNRVGRYCEQENVRLPSLRRVLSAGAPVPPEVLRRMKDCIHPAGDVHTPYGATEALPVSSIAAGEALAETVAASAEGAGTCVGRRFPGIRWKVIRIVDGPIDSINDAQPLPAGQIGELIVSGPVVTREYVTRVEANRTAKIADGDALWHRMGDAGYLDEAGRFWFCGRVAHRVLTADGTMYSVPCEAIFNQHPRIFRSALVGMGPPGRQRPVIVAEPHEGEMPDTPAGRTILMEELRKMAAGHEHTRSIRDFLLHPSLPVDIRHNAKIFREQLALWAAEKLP